MDVCVIGCGGIGSAAALLLRSYAPDSHLRLFDADAGRIHQALELARAIPGDEPTAAVVNLNGSVDELRAHVKGAAIVLDCSPGRFGPKVAEAALSVGAAYASLTEHVHETAEVIKLTEQHQGTSVIQTGLAPGYIDVLGMVALQRFRAAHGVQKVRRLALRVGAVTQHDIPGPHYGWTWSPIGVAVEYLEPSVVVRGHQVTTAGALSDRETLSICGELWEADLTSGGAADLPDVLHEDIETLDYKTVRYPGHYAWVDSLLVGLAEGPGRADRLQAAMEAVVPVVEDDRIVLAAIVEGDDAEGKPQRLSIEKIILPSVIAGHRLRAIQTTTAAPLVQCALDVLGGRIKGLVSQSMLGEEFLRGAVIQGIYGEP